MKGKRYTTGVKIRILRDADRGQSILEVCRAHNSSEVSFHRWKRQYSQMDLNEARKLKELERENGELKKMLAEALLKTRVLEAVAEKMVGPVHRRQAAHAVVARGLCSRQAACRILLLSRSTFWYQPPPPISVRQARAAATLASGRVARAGRHRELCGGGALWRCPPSAPA